MKKEKITVSKIAELAGVSPATVSRVLNHRSIVKESTIRQVEDAMSNLGYPLMRERENAYAISHQPLIVLNIPGIENVFYQDVIRGARVSAKAHGCHLLIHESPLDRGSIRDFCNLLMRVEAAGTIILNYVAEELLDQIRGIVPLVQCCEYNEEADYPYVSIDDYAAAAVGDKPDASDSLLSAAGAEILNLLFNLLGSHRQFSLLKPSASGFCA